MDIVSTASKKDAAFLTSCSRLFNDALLFFPNVFFENEGVAYYVDRLHAKLNK